MPETTDLPVELPTEYRFAFGTPAASVFTALAIYGATCVTMDSVRYVKRLRANRKARQEIASEQNNTSK